MPFEKGRSKTGGRKKGTSNKVTESLKDKIKDLTEDLYFDVLEDVKKLEPKDRIQFFVKLLPYVMPKQSIELGQKEEGRVIMIEHVEPKPDLSKLNLEELRTYKTLTSKLFPKGESPLD